MSAKPNTTFIYSSLTNSSKRWNGASSYPDCRMLRKKVTFFISAITEKNCGKNHRLLDFEVISRGASACWKRKNGCVLTAVATCSWAGRKEFSDISHLSWSWIEITADKFDDTRVKSHEPGGNCLAGAGKSFRTRRRLSAVLCWRLSVSLGFFESHQYAPDFFYV